MTSQAYNNNDVLLFPLQIWKQTHRIKCSDQLRVKKQDTDCFEHLHAENTKPLVSVSISHAWIFLSTLGFLWFLQGEGEELRNFNRMGDRCWCSCGYFLPSYLVEKSVVKLTFGSINSGEIWKITYMRNKTRSVSFQFRNFWEIVYFIHERLSELNSLACNLLDISI